MEKGEPQVVFTPKASESIDQIVIYIEEKGYPNTAQIFADRLYQFGQSLSLLPDKYPICRFIQFAKYGYHCAVFEHNYVFIYKHTGEYCIILNVIHTKRLK